MQITSRELPSISNNGRKVYSAELSCLSLRAGLLKLSSDYSSSSLSGMKTPQKSLWSKHAKWDMQTISFRNATLKPYEQIMHPTISRERERDIFCARHPEPEAATSAAGERQGWQRYHASTLTLCGQRQRSSWGCSCTVVLLGPTFRNAALYLCSASTSPCSGEFRRTFFHQLPSQVYSSEAGIVWRTWSIAHCHTVAAGVVPNTLTSKLAPVCDNCKVLLSTI